MYIESVPNRESPPAILLREAYREDGKVRKRTLANLSCLAPEVVEGLKVLLKGGVAVPSAESVFTVERSLPHGHVAAVLAVARRCEAAHWFGSAPEPLSPLLLAMLVARVIEPASKLATHRMLHDETAANSLGRVLGVSDARREDLYRALDWLHEAQPAIEQRLARKHLAGKSLVLYDLSSTWVTGHCCELAARGHSRDGHLEDEQIAFGLICTTEGCPIAIEVFPGNTGDPATVAAQVAKLKERFGIERIAWVGDRGMLTSARIRKDLKPQGMDWVSSLRAPQIALLAAEHGPFQPSLFDERDLIELTSEHFPGERLIVCRNPLLAAERARKREELLAATEGELERIATATRRARQPLRGTQEISVRVGRVIERYRMGKHFEIAVRNDSVTYSRKTQQIADEAALDGLYVIRTSVAAQALSAEQAVSAYKGLAHVERAFRSMKTVDLNIRPIYHYSSPRVRAHVFLCMLAYYVEWHMRALLKPMLFDDEFIDEAQAARASPVAKAVRSEHARSKDADKTADNGTPLHSFRTLLKDLGTIAYNVAHTRVNPEAKLVITTRPTALQAKAFLLLDANPACTQ